HPHTSLPERFDEKSAPEYLVLGASNRAERLAQTIPPARDTPAHIFAHVSCWSNNAPAHLPDIWGCYLTHLSEPIHSVQVQVNGSPGHLFEKHLFADRYNRANCSSYCPQKGNPLHDSQSEALRKSPV